MDQSPSASEARKAALLFLGLLALLGLPCQALIGLAAPGSALRAWAPLVATLVPYLALVGTVWIRDERVPDLGLRRPSVEPVLVGYLMALILSGACWAIAVELGPMLPRVPWEVAAPFGGVVPMVLFYLTIGFLVLLARAAVEELAWRGLFQEALARAGFPASGILSALVYAAWRFPLVLAVLRAAPDPAPVDLRCLAVNLFAVGLILGRERSFAGSILPGAVFKASLDLYYLNLIPLFYFTTPESAALVGPAGPVLAFLLGPLAVWTTVSSLRGNGDEPPPGAAAMA